MRLNWDDMPVFLAIARCGTLTRAAERLDMSVATLSRRINRLEAVLGVPLFVRHQTGYSLSDEGEALLPRAEALDASMRAFREGADSEAQITGTVRLATAENLANPIVIPALAPLLEKHPDLTLEIITDVNTTNLHRRDADLAIRMKRPVRGNVTTRRIGTLGFGLYGSGEYMMSRSTKAGEADITNDRLIAWSEQHSTLKAASWLKHALRGRSPALLTTSLSSQISAAKAGLGLAVLPHFLGQEAGLHRLPIELGLDQPIWLVIHADLSASKRIRTVADHLVATLLQQQDRLSGPTIEL